MKLNFQYAVICNTCGVQELSEKEYDAQLSCSDRTWRCPKCRDDARWDDNCLETSGNEEDYVLRSSPDPTFNALVKALQFIADELDTVDSVSNVSRISIFAVIREALSLAQQPLKEIGGMSKKEWNHVSHLVWNESGPLGTKLEKIIDMMKE